MRRFLIKTGKFIVCQGIACSMLCTADLQAQQAFVNTPGMEKELRKYPKEIQLTKDDKGHMINESQCFSKDGSWIVYDTRNMETTIPANPEIAMVHTSTRKIKSLYKTDVQSEFGPGVGAVTFSPVVNKAIFIHGLRNCNESNPYTFSRRTGVAVSIDRPGVIEYMDARDVIPPFTPGALRGGTHAHSWSADGSWVSFTYNDDVIAKKALTDKNFKDLRVVGVMNDSRNVKVPHDENPENNHGLMFAAVVTEVTENPAWNTDQIDKAFDEGWIGTNGYIKPNGERQQRAIAFQGNVRNAQGKTLTEVFVVDLPNDITKSRPGCPIQGTENMRPCVPDGVKQRRITFTTNGIQGPRFWLRTTPDGSQIGFLATDEKGIIQVFVVSPNGGAIRQITFNKFSVEGPINFSPNGRQVAYIAGKRVCMTSL
ncbi:MAG TPA: DUF3748 domain-containing protein, partial [Flavitalea sp.]|nr:DUF3748 domain-containing protein [Flavitalea sp.]